MEDITRRSFMGTMGAAALVGVVAAGAGASAALAEGSGSGSASASASGSPASAASASGSASASASASAAASSSAAGSASAVVYDTANPGDLVCDDGTIIPAVYVRLRNKINRVGFGSGSIITSADGKPWKWYMTLFTEDDAQHAVMMPTDRMFSAIEYADIAGIPEDESLNILEDMAHRNLLYRVRRGGVAYFHMLPDAHGLYEFNHESYSVDWLTEHTESRGADFASALYNAETPMYRTVPINSDVVDGGTFATPLDDWQAVIKRATTVAVTPCQCRKAKQTLGKLKCEHPLRTCIQTGEMAEFYIENGIGEEITQDEALKIVQDNVDGGMAVEIANSTDCEVICQCHSDCCGLLGFINLVGGTGDAMENVSHYVMTVDHDLCQKCLACVDQCVMQTISVDSDGYPGVAATCVGCGQCATVCPAGARILKRKDYFPAIPTTLMEDYNEKYNARVKKGYLKDYEVGLGTCVPMDPKK